MNELKMTLNQIRNEASKAFADGYDNPEDMSGCTNLANQEFQCCGDDCSECSGNNECRTARSTCTNAGCSCQCSTQNGTTATENSENGTAECCSMMSCPNDNLESCIYERRWEMTEHTPPADITDETGSSVQYVKVIRIIRNYRAS